MKAFSFVAGTALLCALQGCVTTHAPLSLPEKVETESTRLTLGLVQQTLKKGVSKDEVISKLGSPNMVTSSSETSETWIYDRISTEVQTESSSGGVRVLGGAVGGSVGAGISAGSSTAASAAVRSQKTLTVIIRFSKGVVDSYQTRATSF